VSTTGRSSDNPAKHFLFAFLIAVGIYILFYQFIEHRRNRKGPWEVTFTNSPSGDPQMIVNQPSLAIKNVHLTFAGTSAKPLNPGITLRFDTPRPVPYDLPFGKCIFMDTTFLPGTATFQLFNHEIEFLPRTMIVDHEEHTWVPDMSITLTNRDGNSESRKTSP
jgi:hypothetical protein